MNTKSIIGIGLLILIVAAMAVVVSMHHKTSAALINAPTNTKTSNTYSNQSASNTSRILFSSTQYAPYSYLVYPGPISQQAQAALSGFNLTSTQLQNGSTEINLTLVAAGQSQQIILKPGYRLYVVEAAFGDDGYHFDSAFSDDGFVVVDSNGYLVQ